MFELGITFATDPQRQLTECDGYSYKGAVNTFDYFAFCYENKKKMDKGASVQCILQDGINDFVTDDNDHSSPREKKSQYNQVLEYNLFQHSDSCSLMLQAKSRQGIRRKSSGKLVIQN